MTVMMTNPGTPVVYKIVSERGSVEVLRSGRTPEAMRSYSDRGLHGYVVDDMGQRIISGDLTASVLIDITELSTRYDVSRTVVREALKVLSGKGLIDARPKRGTFVRDRDDWNLLDPDVLRWQFALTDNPMILEQLHEVRVMVEPAAAELAAQRRTDADLEVLDEALQEMQASDVSTDGIVSADQRYHRGLIDATHNELVAQLSFVIDIGLSARDRYVHNHRVSIKRGLQRHRNVVEAVRAQDPVAARTAMLELLEAAARDVREVSGASRAKRTTRKSER